MLLFELKPSAVWMKVFLLGFVENQPGQDFFCPFTPSPLSCLLSSSTNWNQLSEKYFRWQLTAATLTKAKIKAYTNIMKN